MTSLKTKIVLILVGIFLLYGFVDYTIQRLIIFPSFLALEREEARQDIARCVQALKREIYHLDALCHDWAAWNDTYAFVQMPTTDYVAANLVPETFVNNGLHLLYILNTTGMVVWGEIYDARDKLPIEMSDFPKPFFPMNHPLLAPTTSRTPLEDVKIAGVFMTGRGPMLISARPILDSANQGPIRGTLLMGRLLDDELIRTLGEQTQVDFRITPLQQPHLEPAISAIVQQLTPKAPYRITEQGADVLQIDTTFSDIKGNPALLISAQLARKISARGTSTFRYALSSLFAAGLTLLLVLLGLFQNVVLNPISRLTQHAVAIGQTGNLNRHLLIPRQDEIGVLAQEFDQMLIQLAAARKQLLKQSYDAGMAELAAGILHNVRNALTPLLEKIEQIRMNFNTLPLPELAKAHAELQIDTLAEERRAALIKFSLLANQRLIDMIAETKAILHEATDSINQIEQILANHQQWAYCDRPTESIPLTELMHDALAFLKQEQLAVFVMQIASGFAASGSVLGNRTTLVQVFANILINAAEAIQRGGNLPGQVAIQASPEHEGERPLIHVQIRDTGAGIAPELLDQIFARGFSTKSGSPSRIGLHWCANAIAAMQGRIAVESAGLGQGACFHLWLPQGEHTQQGGSDAE